MKKFAIESTRVETNFSRRAGYQLELAIDKVMEEENIERGNNEIVVLAVLFKKNDTRLPAPHRKQKDNDLSFLAKALGERGGYMTKKRGSDYYRRIGKRGLAKRYKK